MGCGKGGRGPAFHNLTGLSGLARRRSLHDSPRDNQTSLKGEQQ
jgi:hypothetical protein